MSEADALSHVAGYATFNDVSERAFQIEFGGQWVKGKSCDSFAPIGPYLVTADEVPDPQNLDLWLDVNGTRRQTGNTRTMVFSVAEIISFLSRFMTLLPGDVIATGTNHRGLSALQDGDKVELSVEGLGTLHFDLRDDLKRTWPRTTRLEMTEQGKEGTAPQATGKYA